MKTLKNLIFATILILFSASGTSQTSIKNNEEPAVITLVSSKNVGEATELVVEFEGQVITDTWNKDSLVRIEMEIKASGVSREVIKHLVTKRRFVINTLKQEDGSLLLFTPNLHLDVFINGKRLSEDISYRLLVPENLSVWIRPASN